MRAGMSAVTAIMLAAATSTAARATAAVLFAARGGASWLTSRSTFARAMSSAGSTMVTSRAAMMPRTKLIKCGRSWLVQVQSRDTAGPPTRPVTSTFTTPATPSTASSADGGIDVYNPSLDG